MNLRPIWAAALLLGATTVDAANTDVVCALVDTAPQIDGDGSDPVWSRASRALTHDTVAKIDLQLSCVFTPEQIFFRVNFADESQNRAHKSLVWDPAVNRYRTGPKREDVFVFKWSMEPVQVDLTLSSEEPYRADVWYWKAYRTDPTGYADDKIQVYSAAASRNATKLISKSGRRFYLLRQGDAGTSAYRVKIFSEYAGNTVSKYEHREPTGSRADVLAKGTWDDERWTVEFARRLTTGNPDDIQLDPLRSYQFGVSRFEVAGQAPNVALEIPEFGSGEIGENLRLVFTLGEALGP